MEQTARQLKSTIENNLDIMFFFFFLDRILTIKNYQLFHRLQFIHFYNSQKIKIFITIILITKEYYYYSNFYNN